ncbi:MAG: hypothetical protein MMC33_000794 [Icmadophila ericetorum]|nr:hypothetical protein [Icmadophila ericetorum]
MTPGMRWLRIIQLVFTSLYTMDLTTVNLVLDDASPPERGYLETLRKDTEQVLAEEEGKWTKDSVAKMIRMDSAFHKSMRLNGIVTRGPERLVVAPDGVTMPTGLHLPEGIHVGIACFDNDIYPNAPNFNAFRFSRMH